MQYIKFFRIKLRVFSLLVILFSQGIFPNNDKNLLILGDSISAGYGIPSEIQWVNILQELCNSTKLGVKIINASISGDTTLGGLSRIPKLLNKYSPEFLLIELGGNDALRGYPVEKIKDKINSEGFENAAINFSISESAIRGGDLGWINENVISKKIW